MKKLFHLMIAGVLVLSVTGCGKSETFRTRNGGPEDVVNDGNVPTPVGSNRAGTVYTKMTPLVISPRDSHALIVPVSRKAAAAPVDKNSTASSTHKFAKVVDAATKANIKKPGYGTKAKGFAVAGLKSFGGTMLTSIAQNALALIPPIPGMPPVLAGLLGLQGEPDTALLDAIAAIEAHLVRIDEQLTQMSDQLTSLQSGVNATIGLVNYVIQQNKCATADARYTELGRLMVGIDASWQILFGNSANEGLQKGIIERMKTDVKNKVLSTPFTLAETSRLTTVKNNLVRNNINDALVNLRRILFSSTTQSGLIYAAQNCGNRRFLSNQDSLNNQALVLGFMVLLEKIATLQAWSIAYNTTPFPIADFNDTLLKYSEIEKKLSVLGSFEIPLGQVLDTQTNKMWAHGQDNIRLVEAMNTCVNTDVDNIAEVMLKTGQLAGTLVQQNLTCVANTAIDMPITVGDKYKWRLPAIYEISQQATTKVLWQGLGDFPKTTNALFATWTSGCGVTRLNACADPATYLKDQGAEWLVNSETDLTDVVATGFSDSRPQEGLIWSSTSMAAAASGTPPYPRATSTDSAVTSNSNIVRENDRSLDLSSLRTKVNEEWADENCGGNNRGLCKKHMFAIKTGDANSWKYDLHHQACTNLYAANELRIAGGSYRSNCSNYKTSDLCQGGNLRTNKDLAKSKFTYGDTPIPHTLASVRTADLYASNHEDEQVHAIAWHKVWGGSIDCTDVKDTSNDYDKCCQYTQLLSSVSFPEFGRTLFVRDLKTDEFYQFNEASGGFKGEATLLSEVTAPVINIVAVGGIYNVKAEGALESRCALDPATAPTGWGSFVDPDPKKCIVGETPMSLKPGTHTIYAMAKSASGLDSGVVTATTVFVGAAAAPPDFEVTAGEKTIVVTLKSASNSDYEYVAKAFDGTNTKTCKITTNTCAIFGLDNKVEYKVAIETSWGEQKSVSSEKLATPFGVPPDFTCLTVLEESSKVTLNCSSSREPGVVQTPVARYVVNIGNNGLSGAIDCEPNKNCVINNLQNGVETPLDVQAINASGSKEKSLMVKSVGKPADPIDVNSSGSEGRINVRWNVLGTGYAATKYVATATSGLVNYSCTSAQTMVDGIVTSPEPTCVITVPETDSDLAYSVVVKGGNGNCSESSTTCNYSESVLSAPATIKPQFPPDTPTLVAEVKESKITITATPGTNYRSTDVIRITSSPTGLSCDVNANTQWKCVIGNFSPGQSYAFNGTGYNGINRAGLTGTSTAVTVYAPPTQPVISETLTRNQGILVTIGPSTDVIDSYTVTATDGTRNFTCQISRPNLSCEVTGLTNDTTYSVSAKAQNNGGVSDESVLKPGLKPFGVPDPGSAPTVTLDTKGGSAVFRVSVRRPKGEGIFKYKVRMVNGNEECEIRVPSTSCEIPIDDSFRGFGLQFTSTATNRIGESLPSLLSETIKYERAPLAPEDVILTPNYLDLTLKLADITAKVVSDADSSIATKFEVIASSGSENIISCKAPADGICSLKDVDRGKTYTVTVRAINASGTSQGLSRLYRVPGSPEVPKDLTAVATSTGITVELGARKIPTDTDSVRVTATPSVGAKLSCIIYLPANTCAIDSDPTKIYKISAVGEATFGEKPSASASFTPTGVVKTIAAASRKSPVGVTSGPQIYKTINLGKKTTSKIKIETVYSDFIKPRPRSADKVSLLKFSGKVKSDSKKICKTKGSDVILLKKGVCNISAKFKVIENKKSKTVELPAKITVR